MVFHRYSEKHGVENSLPNIFTRSASLDLFEIPFTVKFRLGSTLARKVRFYRFCNNIQFTLACFSPPSYRLNINSIDISSGCYGAPWRESWMTFFGSLVQCLKYIMSILLNPNLAQWKRKYVYPKTRTKMIKCNKGINGNIPNLETRQLYQ